MRSSRAALGRKYGQWPGKQTLDHGEAHQLEGVGSCPHRASVIRCLLPLRKTRTSGNANSELPALDSKHHPGGDNAKPRAFMRKAT